MDKSKTTNNPSSYEVESKVENFHWWFVVRRKLLKSILSSIQIPRNCLALDIGCGTGSNLRTLTSSGFYTIGLDRSIYALTLVKKRKKNKHDFHLLAGDLNNLPIKTKSVGLIIAMDIFEHLENDVNGIRESYRALVDGGVLIVTVPAFEFLWGIQDVVTGHKRRYLGKDITKKLREAGFDILKSSYFNFFLFIPILLARRIVRLFGLKIESENELNFSLMNFFLKAIFSLELYTLKYFSFPFGVSIFCVAKKIK
jgi:SAM-dependent methyltransferase